MQPDNPYISYKPTITREGQAKLAEMVSDPQANVYAINDEVPQIASAQAFARFAVGGGDVRTALLTEIGGTAEHVPYGRDSFQQTVHLRVVVERVSLLVTQLIEQARLASYVEPGPQVPLQDTYILPLVDDALQQECREVMRSISDSRTAIIDHLTQQGIRSEEIQGVARMLFPVGTHSSVVITASMRTFHSIIEILESSTIAEAVSVAATIRNVLLQIAPRVALPLEMGGITDGAPISQIGKQLLNAHDESKDGSVRLLNVSPLDERSLAPTLLYGTSKLSYAELMRQSDSWDNQTIESIFDAYFKTYPGRALEEVYYTWEVVCDYETFRTLQRHRIIDAFEYQPLTPDLGFPIPQIIENNGLNARYQDAFRRSEYLYNRLAQAGCGMEAQYAALMGHRIRCRFITNARQLFHMIELRTQGSDGAALVCQEMYNQVQRIHPLLASHIKISERS